MSFTPSSSHFQYLVTTLSLRLVFILLPVTIPEIKHAISNSLHNKEISPEANTAAVISRVSYLIYWK